MTPETFPTVLAGCQPCARRAAGAGHRLDRGGRGRTSRAACASVGGGGRGTGWPGGVEGGRWIKDARGCSDTLPLETRATFPPHGPPLGSRCVP